MRGPFPAALGGRKGGRSLPTRSPGAAGLQRPGGRVCGTETSNALRCKGIGEVSSEEDKGTWRAPEVEHRGC